MQYQILEWPMILIIYFVTARLKAMSAISGLKSVLNPHYNNVNFKNLIK